MIYFLEGRGLFVLILFIVLSLGLARLLLQRNPKLKKVDALVLSFVLIFEPALLAYCVWSVHRESMEIARLMLFSYSFLKSVSFIYLVFEIPSVYLAWQYYLSPTLESIRLLRFSMFLPIVFTAVAFLEAPEMIWHENHLLLKDYLAQIVIFVVILNSLLLGWSYLREKTK